MRTPRVHVGSALAGRQRIELPPAPSRHLLKALRLAPGDAFVAFDGHGGEYDAVLESSRGGRAVARLGAHRAEDRTPPLAVGLVQAIAKGPRMDQVVQKTTELGVAWILPITTERTVVRLDTGRAAARREHWAAVAVAACEQCGLNRVPEVRAPATLDDWLGAPDGGSRLLLAPGAGATLGGLAAPAGGVSVAVGPEGGFSPAELERCVRQGATPIGLGPRVLRTETAGAAVIAALLARFGDFD